MPFCFQCHLEYEAGVPECIECGVPLVDHLPSEVDEVGADGEDQIAYDLHEWTGEARRHLDQLVTAAGIVHAWQGASLVIAASDEERLDELVEDVETSMLPSLDPDAEKVVYELADWTPEQQTRLSGRLGIAGIPHEFDVDGDLVAHAEDEDDIDRLVEEVRAALADDVEAGEVLEGVELQDLLSAVYLAAEDLLRNVGDHHAVLALHDQGSRLVGVALPFGFDQTRWHEIRTATATLIERLADEEVPDDDVLDAAAEVRGALDGMV